MLSGRVQMKRMSVLNKQKDVRRRRRENPTAQATVASEPIGRIVALTKAGLVNHHCQKQQQPQPAQCIHCGKVLHQQGLHNHQ